MSQQQMPLFVIGVTCEPRFFPQRLNAIEYFEEKETITLSSIDFLDDRGEGEL